MVKHKSRYSCESVMYFNLGPAIIKENLPFTLTKLILLQQYLTEVMKVF